MQIYLVTTNNGDGSNGLWWFKDTTLEQLHELEEKFPDTFSSGDGLQYKLLNVTEQFFKDNDCLFPTTYDEYMRDYA